MQIEPIRANLAGAYPKDFDCVIVSSYAVPGSNVLPGGLGVSAATWRQLCFPASEDNDISVSRGHIQ